MSTDRQIAANRQNAQKSTGPKTEDGKAASSGNARRHGLTGALGADIVLSWYRVILEDETAVPDPFEQDSYFRAAADLARAEANLQRLRKANEQWLLGPEALPTKKMSPTAGEKLLQETRTMLLDTLLEEAFFHKRLRVAREGRFLTERFLRPVDVEVFFDLLEEHANDRTVKVGWDRKGFGLLRRIDRAIERDQQRGQTSHEKRGRTLARYLASAEARRRTALKRWIEQIARQRKIEKESA